jgi:hypothetical protein
MSVRRFTFSRHPPACAERNRPMAGEPKANPAPRRIDRGRVIGDCFRDPMPAAGGPLTPSFEEIRG